METIETDLPCARCGYNLRTLPRDGACPECGESTARSVVVDTEKHDGIRRLAAVAMHRLSSARRATGFAIGAWCAASLMILMPASVLNRHVTVSMGLACLLPLVGSFVLGCFAAWHAAGWYTSRLAKAWLRMLSIVAIASCGLSQINDSWAIAWLPTWVVSRERVTRLIDAAGAVGFLAEVVSLLPIALTLGLFAEMAGCARSKRLRGGLVALMLLAGLAGVFDLVAAASTRYRPAISAMVIRVSPVGTWPVAAFAPRLLTSDSSVRSLLSAAVAGLLAFHAALLLAFLALHRLLTRAIQLGELPAASSRSSPAPRPPA